MTTTLTPLVTWPPRKINLNDPTVCTITTDSVDGQFGTDIITNSYFQRIVGGIPEIIYRFSEIMIEFVTPKRIRQIKIAGQVSIKNRIYKGSILLQGKNEISDSWTDISVLNNAVNGDWVLDQTIPYNETMEFLFYRIYLGEKGKIYDAVTEIELYE